jgi:thiamine transporter
MLVEAGIMIALAQILSYVKIFEMPLGGSVTAGSMVPILVFAVRWGAKKGLLVGMVYGILQFLLGPKWSFHPLSIFLDYVAAFALLGLVGLFKRDTKGITIGTFMGIFGRFASHVISGVVVFASSAPEGSHPLLYSIAYNGAYLLPEFIISLILVLFLVNKVKFLSINEKI